MNKLFFASLVSIVFLMPSKAKAQGGSFYAFDVGTSTGTIQTIALLQNSVVDVATATASGKINGAHVIEVYNIASSTKTINCSYDANVSTITGNVNYGREILAGTGMQFAILQGKIALYCATQNTTGSMNATITQIR